MAAGGTIYELDENLFSLLASHDNAPLRQRRRERLGQSFATSFSEYGETQRVEQATIQEEYFPQTRNDSGTRSTLGERQLSSPDLFPAGAKVTFASNEDPTKDNRQVRLANVAFLFLGIGVAVAWTSIRAGISFFTEHFALGGRTYNFLQIAYNVPILPLLILQTLYDEKYDEKFSSTRAYVFRFTVSMLVMTGCLLIVLAASQTWVLVSATLVGVFDAVAFGTASQLFCLFSPSASGFYLLGASLSSVVSVILTFSTGFDAEASLGKLQIFYSIASLFCVIGLVAALYIIRSPLGQHYLKLRDAALKSARAKSDAVEVASWGASTDKKPLLEGNTSDGPQFNSAASVAPSEAPPPAVSNWGLLRMTLLCHVALFLCWACTNLMDSLIAFVPSQKDTAQSTNGTFKLILLYCSLGGELLGKQFNLIRRGRLINGPKSLLTAVCVRALFMIPMVLYVCQPLFLNGQYKFRLDGVIVAAQVLFDATGSYLSSLTYAVAPSLLPHASLRAQSSTLLAITLMLGVFLGLGISLGLANVLSQTTIVY